MDFERKNATDTSPGLCGFSFDLIGNKKIPISEAEEIEIVNDVEERLKRIFDLSLIVKGFRSNSKNSMVW